jgi:biotin carboxylase
VEGVATTIPFHRRVIAHPEFAAGRVHTRWLETAFGDVEENSRAS